MSTKLKIGLAIATAATCFALGRYTTPTKVIETVKTVEVEKKQEQVKTDQDKHKETTTTETDAPDGTKTLVTKVVEDTQTDTKKSSSDQIVTKQTETKETTRGGSIASFALLGGIQPSFSGGLSAGPLVYGASASKQVLGPVSVGVFGLSNGVGGLSIGLIF